MDEAHPPARARQVEGAGHHPEIGHPRPADRERGHEGAAEARADELEQGLQAGGAEVGQLAVRLRAPAEVRHLVAQAVAVGEEQQVAPAISGDCPAACLGIRSPEGSPGPRR